MSLKLILAIVGVTIAALLFFPSGESVAVRYRATAMIVVDGKEYSGSTVRETSYTDTPNSLSGFSASVRDKGEAIAVDLGEGRNPVYVLLNDREGASTSRSSSPAASASRRESRPIRSGSQRCVE